MIGMTLPAIEYAESIKIVERFFLKTLHSGFLFSVTNDEVLQREVNSTLLFLLQGKGKTIRIHVWESGSEALHPLEQLRGLIKKFPETNGLIFTGLDAALYQSPNLLVQLNFGREALSSFGIPMLFWLTSRSLQQINIDALDLYNQRAGTNLYFELPIETADTDQTAMHYVMQERVRVNEDLRHIEARLKLLEEQLKEAEKNQRDPVEIAKEIVIELLQLYCQIPGANRLMQLLIDRYYNNFELEDPIQCNVVATTFKYLGEYEKARFLIEKALSRYREFARANPETYLPAVANMLNNLAILQQDQNDLPAAEQGFKEALKIRQDLASTNPEAYLPYVAQTFNNLAILQTNQNKINAAEQGFKEALEIKRSIARTNQTYLADVAITLNNLANLQRTKHEFTDAEKSYKEALEIRRSLLRTNPQTYLADVALTLNNLADLQKARNKFSEAEQWYNEALEAYRQLAASNPQAYLPYVARTLIKLGDFYHYAVNDKMQSLACIGEAFSIILPLKEQLPLPYIHKYVDGARSVVKEWGIEPDEFIKQL